MALCKSWYMRAEKRARFTVSLGFAARQTSMTCLVRKSRLCDTGEKSPLLIGSFLLKCIGEIGSSAASDGRIV